MTEQETMQKFRKKFNSRDFKKQNFIPWTEKHTVLIFNFSSINTPQLNWTSEPSAGKYIQKGGGEQNNPTRKCKILFKTEKTHHN